MSIFGLTCGGLKSAGSRRWITEYFLRSAMTIQNHFLAAVLTVVSWSITYSLATAAPIICSSAKSDIERAICSQPELLIRDQAISARLNALKQQCHASEKLLEQGQRFWLREQWDCRNVEGAFATPNVLHICLVSRMDQRLQQLGDVGLGCDFTSLVSTYRFVDVDYLLHFSEHYIDKTVSVFGSMDLANCDVPSASPTAATLVGNDRKRDRFRAKFSAMPAERREMLCATHPAGHWSGTIMRDSQGYYLFLTNILGQEFPPS